MAECTWLRRVKISVMFSLLGTCLLHSFCQRSLNRCSRFTSSQKHFSGTCCYPSPAVTSLPTLPQFCVCLLSPLFPNCVCAVSSALASSLIFAAPLFSFSLSWSSRFLSRILCGVACPSSALLFQCLAVASLPACARG